MAAAGPLTPRTARIKEARQLLVRRTRHQRRLFLAEGPQCVRAALGRPGCGVEVFATTAATGRHRDLAALAGTAELPWTEVTDDALAALADTVTPQGVVAVCRFVDVPPRAVLDGRPRLLVVGVDVRDPGNAGTLLRCADAAGADGVLFVGDGVDPYNPKAVRAGAGSLFHLPVAMDPDTAAVVAAVRTAGLQVLAADGGAATDLDEAERRGLLGRPTAWLLGNEARGLDGEVLASADEAVAVPLHGRAESLNLAAAAAVCLYASARVQRLAGPAAGH